MGGGGNPVIFTDKVTLGAEVLRYFYMRLRYFDIFVAQNITIRLTEVMPVIEFELGRFSGSLHLNCHVLCQRRET